MNESIHNPQASDIIHHRNECYCYCCLAEHVYLYWTHTIYMKHLWRTLFHIRNNHRARAPTKATKHFKNEKEKKELIWTINKRQSEWEQAQEDENQMQKRKITRKCSYMCNVYDWAREWPEWNKFMLCTYNSYTIKPSWEDC